MNNTILSRSVNCFLQDGLLDLSENLRRCDGCRSITSHSACIWTLVAVEDPLVILCSGKWNNCVPVAECQDADLIAFQELFNNYLIAWY